MNSGRNNLSILKFSFCLSSASPASSRKSAPSLSRSSSPSGSPKSSGGGRRPGRLRLPQLSSRHRLSNSKENLDAGANSEAEPREGAAQADTEAVVSAAGGSAASGEANVPEPVGSSEVLSSTSEVVLVNGDSNGLSSGCSTESCMEPDNMLLQHRDNTCPDAIYNLYAISVGYCHAVIQNTAIEQTPWHCCEMV